MTENEPPPLHAMSGLSTDAPTVPCSRSALFPSARVKSPVLRIFVDGSDGDGSEGDGSDGDGEGDVEVMSSAGVASGSAVPDVPVAAGVSGSAESWAAADGGASGSRDVLFPVWTISVTIRPRTGTRMPTTHQDHFGGP
ncbi:hypothetical protein [Streptomyces sp. NBC_00102]|uniref:hypothetical protein n=1 Tax=Streptomyces sp. NBC_00102 TaxID=2975652 RepID=UPI0022508B04|nr:hypothetical protein [Streptomyces sp. NBC_00102]MCX5398115.1 hypothetical protein [Streptomyces sp. NBC_00102]